MEELVYRLIQSKGDWRVGNEVAKEMIRYGSKIVPKLIQILNNHELHIETRKAAAYALGGIGDDRAIEPLKKIATGFWTNFEMREKERLAQGIAHNEHLGLAMEVKDALAKLGIKIVFD